MAKQRGLHQIKGKVGEHSYYSQSGVVGGLIRSINQGMSSRVKTSEEFANTRKNNAEFGNAADTAKYLVRVVTPKFRPMFLNFSQAKLTKGLLDILKSKTQATWGQREFTTGDGSAIADALNLLAKNDPSLLYGSIRQSTTGSNALFTISPADGAIDILRSWGADGAFLKIMRCNVYAGKFLNNVQGYAPGTWTRIGIGELKMPVADFDASEPDEMTIPSGTSVPQPTGQTGFAFNVVVVMPYRTLGGSDSILQEHCSFHVWETDFE